MTDLELLELASKAAGIYKDAAIVSKWWGSGMVALIEL